MLIISFVFVASQIKIERDDKLRVHVDLISVEDQQFVISNAFITILSGKFILYYSSICYWIIHICVHSKKYIPAVKKYIYVVSDVASEKSGRFFCFT